MCPPDGAPRNHFKEKIARHNVSKKYFRIQKTERDVSLQFHPGTKLRQDIKNIGPAKPKKQSKSTAMMSHQN